MASDCLFCKIVAGEIPAKKVYEDANLLAFHDIAPKAPTHIVLIPRRHINSLAAVCSEDAGTMAELLCAAPTIAAQLGLTNGFRTVINTGPDGGQTVGHLHLHILVSDGNDHGSKNPMSDAIQMCQRAETTVYSVSPHVGTGGEAGDDVLRAISTETGGRPFFLTRPREIAHAFAEIKEELGNQYSLEYVPANLEGDGLFRTIHLATINPRYHVRTRKGYFSPVFRRDQPYVFR